MCTGVRYTPPVWAIQEPQSIINKNLGGKLHECEAQDRREQVQAKSKTEEEILPANRHGRSVVDTGADGCPARAGGDFGGGNYDEEKDLVVSRRPLVVRG